MPHGPATNAARSVGSAAAAAANRSNASPSSRPSRRMHRLAWNRSPARIRSRHASTAAACPAGAGVQRQSRVENGRAAGGSASRAASSSRRRSDRRLALGRHERLEPPAPGRVHPHDVVVEGERAVRERHRSRRRRVPGLDAVARLEAEEPDPAAADRGAVAAGDVRLLVEQREQVVSRPGHADGAGAEQRPAPRPRADQRERPVLAAEDERRPGRGDGGLERLADEDGAHAPDPRGVRARPASTGSRRRRGPSMRSPGWRSCRSGRSPRCPPCRPSGSSTR